MGIIRDSDGRNEVVRKIWEFANSAFGGDRVIIRCAKNNEIVPDGMYEWKLFKHEADEAPVENVAIEVSHSEMMEMDAEVQAECARVQREE